jgi:hypothetical protein
MKNIQDVKIRKNNSIFFDFFLVLIYNLNLNFFI